MNNIFKKVISAAIAVSTLCSIALPVYAAETPEVSEDNITTAEATEKFSIKDEYYKYLKKDQRRATILQSLDESDVISVNKYNEGYVQGVDEDGIPYKYSVTIAPNGHIFYMYDTTSQYTWLNEIQRAIDKGNSKVVDGRTFITIEGVDYEYYIDTAKNGAEYSGFYWNFPGAYDIPSYVGSVVRYNFYKIDSVFDAMQEGYELYKEAIENDTLAYNVMNYEYVDGERIFSMPDDEEMFADLKLEILNELCVPFRYSNVEKVADLSGTLKEQYDQSCDEVKAIAGLIIEGTWPDMRALPDNIDSIQISGNTLVQIYSGDINGDNMIDMNDVTLLKKQLIHKVELSPMQQRMTSTNGESTLDVRDVTKLTQYLVKMTDSIN